MKDAPRDLSDLCTVTQLAEEIQWVTPNMIREWLRERDKNGFAAMGCCLRVGRRLFLSKKNIARWIWSNPPSSSRKIRQIKHRKDKN